MDNRHFTIEERLHTSRSGVPLYWHVEYTAVMQPSEFWVMDDDDEKLVADLELGLGAQSARGSRTSFVGSKTIGSRSRERDS